MSARVSEGSERRFWVVALVAFVAIAALSIGDVLIDRQDGAATMHIVVELVIAGLACLGGGVVLRRLLASQAELRRERARNETIRSELSKTKEEADRWRGEARDLVRGLGAAIDAQFERWELTPAESEVALLLLKGFAHKEVAELRGVASSTVRQQAQSVYKKAGVRGRHELVAFFLEDLILPSHARDLGA